jgi:DNA-binding transcriptional LysR family regulator
MSLFSASEDLALVISPSHALYGKENIDVDDLDGEVFVDYPAGWGIRRSVDQLFADRGLIREIVAEVADCRTAFELAVAGMRIAFVIPSAIHGLDAVLHRVVPTVPFEVSIVTNLNPHPRAAAVAFVDLVRSHFEQGATRP